MANVYEKAIDARIADVKSTEATKAALKTLKSTVANSQIMQMLKDSECKSKFDFDIHAVRQVKDILAVAIGMLKPHSLKLDFEMNMATMVKFANAGKNFTAKDMLISLDSTIKVPAESAALYARRTDHYGSANRWHRAALNVLLSLNAISEVTRGEYQFNDNSLANGLKAAFAE